MQGTGYRRRWERAGKALVNYILGGPWDDGDRSADYQLYHAVLDGEVRVRVKGEILIDLSRIRSERWDDKNPWALPFDLEVNLDDVERIWNWDVYDLADVIARGKLRPGTASFMLETAILNLRALARRLSVRLSAMTIPDARKEIDFDQWWAHHMRDCRLLKSVPGQEIERIDALLKELELAVQYRDWIVGNASESHRKPRAGRKPKYDWAAAKSHIEEKFRYHGALSPDDPDWSCQADVENAIKEFFNYELGSEPATSTARVKAKAFMSEIEAEN